MIVSLLLSSLWELLRYYLCFPLLLEGCFSWGSLSLMYVDHAIQMQ